MTEAFLKALMAWIDARIDEKIQDAFGRDSLHESIREGKCRNELEREFELCP